MHRIGASGGIYFAWLVAEMQVVLCCIVDFLLNRGIRCHQLILAINSNLWNNYWMLSSLLGTGPWHSALETFLLGAQLTAAILPGGTK